MFKLRVVVPIILLVGSIGSCQAEAGLLPPFDMETILHHSLVVDATAALLTSHLGYDGRADLRFNGAREDTAWSGAIQGSFAGYQIDLNMEALIVGNPETSGTIEGTLYNISGNFRDRFSTTFSITESLLDPEKRNLFFYMDRESGPDIILSGDATVGETSLNPGDDWSIRANLFDYLLDYEYDIWITLPKRLFDPSDIVFSRLQISTIPRPPLRRRAVGYYVDRGTVGTLSGKNWTVENGELTAIPEPMSMIIWSLGLAVLLVKCHRRHPRIG